MKSNRYHLIKYFFLSTEQKSMKTSYSDIDHGAMEFFIAQF